MPEKQRRADMSAIEELKNLEKGGYCFIYNALASRLTALERTVKDYKEAVDMVTAWADERDRQAYEKAIKEIPDEPDRAEIVERYAQEVWHRTAVKPEEMGKVRRILNDLLDEVTHERP